MKIMLKIKLELKKGNSISKQGNAISKQGNLTSCLIFKLFTILSHKESVYYFYLKKNILSYHQRTNICKK